MSLWTCTLVYGPSSKSLLRAITPLSMGYLSFFGIDLLKLFISPALKHPQPSTRSSGSACGQSRRRGLNPPGNLGFLRNVLMRRQEASPRFLLWAFWGHSLVRPPHQEGSSFRKSPGKRKGGVGDLQTPEIVCKIQCDWERVQSFTQTLRDIRNPQTFQNPQLWNLPCAEVRLGRILSC